MLNSFSYDQYMSAVKALQSVFCQNHNKVFRNLCFSRNFDETYCIFVVVLKRDEYIVKVLLPEALIKICMRIHQCSKSLAESYLQKSDHSKPIDWSHFMKTAST